MSRPSVVFHVDLVQDVAVLRPLMRLARQEGDLDLALLVTKRFAGLDATGLWAGELDRLCAELGVVRETYGSEVEALARLADRRGLVIAGSESSVSNHVLTHRLMRVLPPCLLGVTLQHGLECVGFLHNERHDATAGLDVRFGADVVVGWFAPERLAALPACERSKLFVAGPTALIDGRPSPRPDVIPPRRGIVCENLHSVRFATDGLKRRFIDVFRGFAGAMAAIGTQTVLRPHPAGRFTERNAVDLPGNVARSTGPLYDEDLTAYGFAISAPSSVLLDFVLARVPVAVWIEGGEVDASNFAGLPTVSSLDDWTAFAQAALARPAELLAGQEAWLSGLAMPADVRTRYVELLALSRSV
ncbi:hypothetical protein [Methylobrevis pamukkalensis]|uniref:CDP-Glycerol:Poly(Glycerophosphate) glycerophosphotransferase n=1 Tax=Methylobrevis pamukkalensis TaxID=1439726 RepID=A0A1E3GWY6_9HYPH|nr:hypothetical protein [Methylobrevis pamukkalensis]ODN68560.1 hypothetical protein A6302_04136 [Methylobrevis pamukkalensis]